MANVSVIITADDGGYSKWRDDAIIYAARHGCVSRTSIMMNGLSMHDMFLRCSRAKIPVNLHLNVSEGTPVLGCSTSLVSKSSPCPTSQRLGTHGHFRGKIGLRAALMHGQIMQDDLDREVRAQLLLFVCHSSGTGSRRAAGDSDKNSHDIIHIDGHQHVHVTSGVARALVSAVASLGCLIAMAKQAKRAVVSELQRELANLADDPTDLKSRRTPAAYKWPDQFGRAMGAGGRASIGSAQGHSARLSAADLALAADTRAVLRASGLDVSIRVPEMEPEEGKYVVEAYEEQRDGVSGMASAASGLGDRSISGLKRTGRILGIEPARADFYVEVSEQAKRARALFEAAGFRCCDAFVGFTLSGPELTKENVMMCARPAIKRLLQRQEGAGRGVPPPLLEIMTHPGAVPGSSERPSEPSGDFVADSGCGCGGDAFSFSIDRAIEYKALVDPEFCGMIGGFGALS